MPRDSPRGDYRRNGEGQSSRYQGRYSRQDDGYKRPRDDGYGRGRGGASRSFEDERDRNGSGRRREEGPGARDGDRGYGRGRDRNREDDRRHDRDDGRRHDRDDRDRDRNRDRDGDSRRAGPGPSRRSASPRARSSKPDSRSRSRSAAAEDKDKAKPNFGHSGLLAAATKTVEHGDGTKTVLKYHEPPEARKPTVGWRLYVFKEKEQVDLLHIQRQSAYLIGRDRAVVDIAVDHPSCSKQHAVIQYRQVQEKNELGDVKTAVKPFIIDLESTNGTIVNDAPIPTSRYYELMLGDVIKFGESVREYVLLSEDAA
ncbi:SMAD/FHA domain-containing protein [Daedaleopsis nitida]|nr:SMAD/FHA domain-containing protein [Daedaleopsis nitida]